MLGYSKHRARVTHSLKNMPPIRNALVFAYGAAMIPCYLASMMPERAFISAANQRIQNSIDTLQNSEFSDGSTKFAQGSDRRNLAEENPLFCLLFFGVCSSASTESACVAESRASCAWDSDSLYCQLDRESYDFNTDQSYQRYNSTALSCSAHSSAASCNAVSVCTYDNDNSACSLNLLGFAEILDEYCPSQDLTSAQSVAQYDMCPFYTNAVKCAQYTSQQTCDADSDCEYTLDPTSPGSSRYPCGAQVTRAVQDVSMNYASDMLRVQHACSKYDSASSCNVVDKCDWDESCQPSDDAYLSIFQNHPHVVRANVGDTTCSDIANAQCGVGETADKCEWREASEGDEAECLATYEFQVKQMSCECDSVAAAAPSVDVSDVTCEAPEVPFIDTGLESGARAVAPIMVVVSALVGALAIFA